MTNNLLTTRLTDYIYSCCTSPAVSCSKSGLLAAFPFFCKKKTSMIDKSNQDSYVSLLCTIQCQRIVPHMRYREGFPTCTSNILIFSFSYIVRKRGKKIPQESLKDACCFLFWISWPTIYFSILTVLCYLFLQTHEIFLHQVFLQTWNLSPGRDLRTGSQHSKGWR
jgi:hypothetical protein